MDSVTAKLPQLAIVACTALQLAVAPQSVAAQIVVAGTVREERNDRPIAGAAVMQLDASGVVRMVATSDEGSFALLLAGGPPFELFVQRIGFASRRVPLDPAAAEGGLYDIEVLMVPEPVALGGIATQVARERPEYARVGWQVTEAGRFWRTRPDLPCMYAAVDSVTIKEPPLLNAVMRRYHRVPTRSEIIKHGDGYWDNRSIPRDRLRHEAWPCGLMILDRWRLPDPPEIDAPEFHLVPAQRWDPLPPRFLPIQSFAVAANGAIAVAPAGGTDIRILSPDGRLNPNVPGGERPVEFGAATQLGWRGDTLWVADTLQRRVLFLPPHGGTPIIHFDRGVLQTEIDSTDQGSAEPARRLPDSALPVPVPLAGGRWLWSRRALEAPQPWAARGERPGRELVSLDAGWDRPRLLAILRPGDAPLAIRAGGVLVELGPQPFRDRPLLAIAPDGGGVIIVRRGLPAAVALNTFTVTRLGAEGDTVFHVSVPAPLIQLTDGVFAAAVNEIASDARLSQRITSADGRRAALSRALYRPRFHPPVSAVVAGNDGRTWLRSPDVRVSSIRWLVLDEQGRIERIVLADRDFQILAASDDRVWGAARQEDGSVQIVQYRLEPTSEQR
jgi:hypothetical protein